MAAITKETEFFFFTPTHKPHLHFRVIELDPIVADVEHKGSAQKEMFVPETRSDTAKIEQIGILAVVFERHQVGLGPVQ
jgi:hypothetical protein